MGENEMLEFKYFQGRLTQIRDLWAEDPSTAGCLKMMTVVDSDGSIVNFVVTPDTYFADHVTLRVGDQVIGFYDANAPVPLIYPPQYEALVMARVTRGRNVEVAFFDSRMRQLSHYRTNATPAEVIERFDLRSPRFGRMCREGLFHDIS